MRGTMPNALVYTSARHMPNALLYASSYTHVAEILPCTFWHLLPSGFQLLCMLQTGIFLLLELQQRLRPLGF